MPEQTAMTATVGLPGPDQRWRCGACGNLTRFDVVRTATTREYWHVELSGEPRVEESETIEQAVRSVVCRWCGRDDAIEVVARPGLPDVAQQTDASVRPGGPP
jgi:hypothetical protein